MTPNNDHQNGVLNRVQIEVQNGALNGVPTLADLPQALPGFKGERVLVRVDYNVPLDEKGQIADDLRIRASIPTLRWLASRGATLRLVSHLGRPKNGVDPKLSLSTAWKRLFELAPELQVSSETLENLRFDPREDSGDLTLAKELCEGCVAYVNEAFAFCHRPTASIVGPPTLLPSAAGLLVESEIKALGGLLTNPARPFVAVLGGAKVADKLGVVKALTAKCDTLIIGGGMAYTFMAAQNRKIGNSLFDATRVEECRELLAASERGVGATILLPSDVVTADENRDNPQVVDGDIADNRQGLDIGPTSQNTFGDVVSKAATVFWNGPMGMFEDDRYSAGTDAVAGALVECAGFTVVGGGDSAAAMTKAGIADQIGHVSTGGGASLELIESGDLPGLAALRNSA